MSWGETLFLKKIIQGEKVFVAAPDIILKVLGNLYPINSNGTPTERLSFKSKLKGTINIRLTTPAVNDTNPTGVNLIVFKNSNKVATYNFAPSETTQTTFLYSINLNKGDIVSFDLQKSKPGDYDYGTTKLEVAAIVLDANYYE